MLPTRILVYHLLIENDHLSQMSNANCLIKNRAVKIGPGDFVFFGTTKCLLHTDLFTENTYLKTSKN